MSLVRVPIGNFAKKSKLLYVYPDFPNNARGNKTRKKSLEDTPN